MKHYLFLPIYLLLATRANAAVLEYFMADRVAIKMIDNTNPSKTVVSVTFDRPCWADFVGVVDSSDTIGNPFDPSAGFKIVFGIVLKEKNAEHSCDTNGPAILKDRRVITTNTNAVEGAFLGFSAVSPNQPKQAP